MTQIPAGLCGIFPNPNPVYEATARQEVIEHRLFNERKRTMTELDIPLHKAIERILDDHSAWIARPNDEVTRSIARLAIIAVHEIISERDALSATPAQDDAVLDSYADENQRLSDRIEDLEAEVAALNLHFDAAYEAAGLSRSSSKPLAHHIMELLAATPAVGGEELIWPPEEMASLMDALARSADRYNSSYGETAHLARNAAKTIRALTVQPEYLTGCLHPGDELGGCQYEGGCQSESCDHYGKTEYRPRMTLLARVDGVLYPKVET